MINLQKYFLCCFLVFILLLYHAASVTAQVNSCVACHTNETVMKSLYKPPVIPQDAGEG